MRTITNFESCNKPRQKSGRIGLAATINSPGERWMRRKRRMRNQPWKKLPNCFGGARPEEVAPMVANYVAIAVSFVGGTGVERNPRTELFPFIPRRGVCTWAQRWKCASDSICPICRRTFSSRRGSHCIRQLDLVWRKSDWGIGSAADEWKLG